MATLKQPLSIRSDKLSEFARMGHVPTAIRCNPYGTGLPSTQFGTWYIAPEVAEGLIADRHAGRPMPWHGKPIERQSARDVSAVAVAPAPDELQDLRRDLGAKRRAQDLRGVRRALPSDRPRGEAAPDVAVEPRSRGRRSRPEGWLLHRPGQARHRQRNTLSAETRGRTAFITRTDATRWISRGSPAGDTQKSWISLETAQQRYLFTGRDLKAFIASGALKSKTGTHGAMRGIVYVSKAQCAKLREEIGFTEQEAARRAKITVPQLRQALPVVNWRGTGAIPLATVQAVIKRLQSNPGYTIAEAAKLIGQDADWVEDRIKDGTVRPLRTKHDHDRLYLSEPMIRRLRTRQSSRRATRPCRERTGSGWVKPHSRRGSPTATIIKWADAGELDRTHGTNGRRYAHATPSGPGRKPTGRPADFAARHRRNGWVRRTHANRDS